MAAYIHPAAVVCGDVTLGDRVSVWPTPHQPNRIVMTESVKVDVVHHPDAKRFTATVDGELATAAYERSGDTITFTHTMVPPAIEGQGVASAIAAVALDHARAEGLSVVPECAFFADFMARNAQYEDLRSS